MRRRHDGKERAAFGDRENWSAATHREFARHARRYKAVATRDGAVAEAPDERWLAGVIYDERDAKGVGYARRYARNIGHYLREVGFTDHTDGVLVRRVLAAPDDMDPLSADFDDVDVPFSLGRARAFADSKYADRTYESYMTTAAKWSGRCRDLGVDALRPPPLEVERWLDELAFRHSFSTVRNARNALSHFFRKRGVPDVAHTSGVRRTLEGLKRAKPPEEVRPLTADERRSILAGIRTDGVGARNRVIVLLTAFTQLGVEDMALLRAEHCRVSNVGVVLDRGGVLPLILVGTHAERDLDIVHWMRKLLERVPPNGPLFRELPSGSFEYAAAAMVPMSVHKIVVRAARKAQIPPRDVAKRLRMLFEAEISAAGVSPVVRAKAIGKRRLPTESSEAARRRNLEMRSARRASPLGAIG